MFDYEIQWEKAMIDRGIGRYLASVQSARFRETQDGHKVSAKNESSTSYGVSLIRKAFAPLEESLNWFVEDSLSKAGRPALAAVMLAAMDTREVAYLVTRCIIDSISRREKLASLAFRISGHIEDHMRLAVFKSTHPSYYRTAQRSVEKNKTSDYRSKRRIFVSMHNKAADPVFVEKSARRKAIEEGLDPIATQDLIDQYLATCDDARWVPWTRHERSTLGGVLIQIFILATSEYKDGGTAIENKLNPDQRILGTGMVELVTLNDNTRHNRQTYVVATEDTIEWIKGNMGICAALHPEFLPTLIPPKDWTTPYNGGYWFPGLREIKPLVKTSKAHLRMLEKVFMPDVYATVNAAQAVAWEVNDFVLGVATDQFKSAHGVKMPSIEPLFIPENPLGNLDQGDMDDKQFRAYKKALRANLTPDEKAVYAEWCEIKRDLIVRDNERKSKVLGVDGILRVARLLAKESEFYYVHSLDYRGRLYPCGTGLNPQGTDLSKALLRLSRGTKLGKHGFWHMALHAAGMYGVDKVSLEDRVRWVLDHTKEIIGTWQDPDAYVAFWGSADKPYMFLAVCAELAEVLMFNPLPNINNCCQFAFQDFAFNYESHLTGNQDGSCNGIQHFSAMLLDPVGAKAVNMMAQDNGNLPEDIYNETCKHVKTELSADLAAGLVRNGKKKEALTVRQARLLREVLPHMNRKTTKRSTMIVPYGGTKRSCLTHVRAWVYEVNDELHMWDDKEVYSIALPLHHYVWHALDTVVVAARKAMKFLRDLMRVNCSLNMPMVWTTPTGFMAWQDIKEVKSKSVDLQMFGRVRIGYNEPTDALNKSKMSSSFPPNFVHSMDAAHLMRTVAASLDCGIRDFALVHDSYGVPFGHVEKFHRIIRQEFVNIYRHNVLIGLKRQQEAQFPHMISSMPADRDVERGTYDIEEVKKAIHFFR
jgi:DNA-directed RNA polymerase